MSAYDTFLRLERDAIKRREACDILTRGSGIIEVLKDSKWVKAEIADLFNATDSTIREGREPKALYTYEVNSRWSLSHFSDENTARQHMLSSGAKGRVVKFLEVVDD